MRFGHSINRAARSRPAWRRGLENFSEKRGWAYWLLAPSFLLLLAVVLYPIVWGVALSFHEMRLNRPDLGTGFIGLKHYTAIASDPVFWLAMRNTIVWTCGSILGEVALGLSAALLLNRDQRGFRFALILLLLPWLLPNVVAGHIWALMLDSRLGILNDVLVWTGLLTTSKAWFADPGTALGAAMLVEIWHGFPFFTLLLLAGLRAIPRALYEAAAIDGAGFLHQFRSITLPQIKAILVATVVLRVISLVNSPDIILILTGGGPGRSTLVLSLHAYLKVNKEFDFGQGSALAVVLFMLLMGFSYMYVHLSNISKD